MQQVTSTMSVSELIAFVSAADLGRKFEATDLINNDGLRNAARFYAREWAQQPTHWANDYMNSMRMRLVGAKPFTDGMLKGILNVMRANAAQAAKVIAQASVANEKSPLALNVAAVRTARFRVVQDDDQSISIRLSVPTMWADAPKGTRKISAMVSGEWQTVGKVQPSGDVSIFKKAGLPLEMRVRKALSTLANADDDLVYILAYAMVGNVCGFCGKELDTAESLSVGYGPKCAKTNSLPWGDKAVPAKVLLAKAKLASAAVDATVGGQGIAAKAAAAMPVVDGFGGIKIRKMPANLNNVWGGTAEADDLAVAGDLLNDVAAGN